MKKLHDRGEYFGSPPLTKFCRTMKLTAVLLLGGFMTVSANGFSQDTRVTLSLNKVKFARFFKEIEKESGYRFAYSNDIIPGGNVVDISLKDTPVSEVLNKVLTPANLRYRFVEETGVIIISGLRAASAAIIVKGRVISKEGGTALPGVTVAVKGKSTGTLTNADGRYEISVASGDVLVFSYYGMKKQEVTVTGDTLDVQLEKDEKDLEEVVITAYGKVKKSSLTDAVASIDGAKLENRPMRSVADGLVGLTPGLNIRAASGAPESTPSLNIRGFTGFGSSGAPLVLVDGVERPIQDVNPNDVESVSVLKDGASTAVYGSRAPYGIVLITTKSGKSGKVAVNYSSNFKYATMAMMPKQLHSYEWAEYVNQLLTSNPDGTGTPVFTKQTIERMKAWSQGDFNNPVFAGLDMKYIRNGQYPDPTSSYGYNFYGSFADIDYFSEYFKSVIPSNEQNLSFSGGTDRVKYYVGLGYNKTDGGIRSFDNFNKRYNALSKVTFKAADWLDLDASLNYVRQEYQGANYRGQGINYFSLFSTVGREYFNVPIRNPDNPNYFTSVVSLGTSQGLGGIQQVTGNRLLFSGGFTARPVKGLEIAGSYNWRINNGQNETSQKIIYQYKPDGSVTIGERTANTSAMYKTYDVDTYKFYKLSAAYSHTFNKQHNLYAQVGFQAEDDLYKSLSGSGQGLYAQNTVTTISTTAGTFQAGDRAYAWSTLGYYGVLTYDFREKYMVKFAARRDASSRFAPESRWGFFPSMSAGWNAAKENFWPLQKWISQFTPRVSWSRSGDLASAGSSNYYTYQPTLAFGISSTNLLGGNFASFANPPGLVSNSLTWAKPTVLDFGLDVSALRNRLTLNYDWYQRTVRDLAGPPNPLPQTLGTSAPNINNSVIETRGWEVKLGWEDKAMLFGKPLTYSATFMMSDYIGYVVEYSANKTGARSGAWTKGEVFGRNFFYRGNGIIQGKSDLDGNVQTGTYNYPGYFMYKDLNGDGYINGGDGGGWYGMGDQEATGYSYPRKTYSIAPSFSWNNIQLSALFDGVGQWTVFNGADYVFGTNGSQWFSPFYKQSTDKGFWNTDRKDAFFPAVNQGRTSNDTYALNLSHLRIRNVTVGYNLPQQWLQKVKLQKVNVYVSGENMGFVYLKSYVKFDPELLAVGGNGYPPYRYYSFGVNVSL